MFVGSLCCLSAKRKNRKLVPATSTSPCGNFANPSPLPLRTAPEPKTPGGRNNISLILRCYPKMKVLPSSKKQTEYAASTSAAASPPTHPPPSPTVQTTHHPPPSQLGCFCPCANSPSVVVLGTGVQAPSTPRQKRQGFCGGHESGAEGSASTIRLRFPRCTSAMDSPPKLCDIFER